MKKLFLTGYAIAGACLLSVTTQSSSAAVYGDSTGENFTGAGGGILDIVSVEVNHTATDLIFKISLAGNPVSTDWGKYMISLDTTAGGTSSGNAWGRPISMSGMDFWFGSWADGGNGVQLHQYSGSWSQIGGSGTFAGGPALPGLSITKDASSITITAPFASLGLSIGNSFLFDIYTSGGGGGDSAVDALANPSQSIADWGNAYTTQTPVSYTLTQVPEPSAAAILAAGAGFMLWRLLRRRDQ